MKLLDERAGVVQGCHGSSFASVVGNAFPPRSLGPTARAVHCGWSANSRSGGRLEALPPDVVDARERRRHPSSVRTNFLGESRDPLKVGVAVSQLSLQLLGKLLELRRTIRCLFDGR